MRSRLTAHWRLLGFSMALAATLGPAAPAHAATISWKGHAWNVTGGGMAGVCQGNAANVAIDASGYLHMKITNNGGTWTAAEIFSTDKLGFGTYQWQIEGAIDKLDKNVVVGLFPYGPEAGLGQSGNNEIDIEFAHWGNDAWPNGNYTIWPPTGSTTGEYTFTFSLGGGTALTTRFSWSSTKIDFATLSGFVAVDATTGLLDSWTFAPANPTTRITQEAMPLGMNLWCFDNPPSDGQNVEIIVRDFQFVPAGGLADGGAGGTDGGRDAGGGAGTGGSGGSGGTTGAAGRDGSAATDASGAGTGGAGAAVGTGGAATGGRVGTGGTATGGAVGTGGAAAGGAAGARSSATGGSPGTGGRATGGGPGSGGAVGSGGPGTGGASRGGAAGTTSSGGAGAAMGSGGAGAAVGTGGMASSGGSVGSNSTAGPAKAASEGCNCKVASTRTSRGWLMFSLGLALLHTDRRRRRRRT
jgi:hypothetical protein